MVNNPSLRQLKFTRSRPKRHLVFRPTSRADKVFRKFDMQKMYYMANTGLDRSFNFDRDMRIGALTLYIDSPDGQFIEGVVPNVQINSEEMFRITTRYYFKLYGRRTFYNTLA